MKKNVIAGYISQFYVTIIGFAMVPLYVRYMGTEAYGLLGFFAMLQTWFSLFDLGLSPAITRVVALYRGGALTAIDLLQILRTLRFIFLVIAVFSGVGFLLISEAVATRWLSSTLLSRQEIINSVEYMGIIMAMRLVGGINRGVITGSERHVWLSGYNVVIASLRFILVFVSMSLWGYTPEIFFIHQLFTSGIELLVLHLYGTNVLPKLETGDKRKIDLNFRLTGGLLKFSLGMAFSSLVWVFVTQVDKLILSGYMTLSDYGYFSMAVMLSNGILLIGAPIANSLIPRLIILKAQNDEKSLVEIYRKATQFVVITAGVAGIVLAIFSGNVLYIWTGDWLAVEKASNILRLYTIGNLFVLIGAFPYYMQCANGRLIYHNIGNVLTMVVYLPLVIYFTIIYGAEGAGWTWMFYQVLGFFVWIGYVHSKINPGLHVDWMAKDIFPMVLPTILIGTTISFFYGNVGSRAEALISTVVVYLVCLLVAIVFSTRIRNKIRNGSILL